MRTEEHASSLLAGGILQRGYQCGMIWGAALAAGTRAYHVHGPGPRAEYAAICAATKLVELFRNQNTHINCMEIIEIDEASSGWQMIKYFLIKGGVIGCIRRATRYAPTALEEIRAALSVENKEGLDSPFSCSAILARKMGASDLQATMASGFAGGIGLCGGACGALGAAMWMIALRSIGDQDGKVAFNNASALDAIERFSKCTDHMFECASIVGRSFESVDDHAAYVRDGGCSEIIETLADCG